MLEKNDVVPGRGNYMLRYVAATPDDAQYVLGKALFQDMKCIRSVKHDELSCSQKGMDEKIKGID